MPMSLQLAARLRGDGAATRDERAVPRDEGRRDREQRDQSSAEWPSLGAPKCLDLSIMSLRKSSEAARYY